jgi:hypothetical protein
MIVAITGDIPFFAFPSVLMVAYPYLMVSIYSFLI